MNCSIFHQDFTEDELVRKFAGADHEISTGEKWSYCNAGYIILGVVIHRVTGKFWFDFVKERIFDPLGMTSTRLNQYRRHHSEPSQWIPHGERPDGRMISGWRRHGALRRMARFTSTSSTWRNGMQRSTPRN